MKKQNSWKNILPTLMVVGVILTVSIACQLFGDSKYQGGDKTPSSTPMSNTNTSKNDKSPTPSPSATSTPTNSSVNNSTNSAPPKSQSYQDNLPSGFSLPNDSVGKRILSDYGAVYVAKAGVVVPPKVMFDNESDCAKWQATIKTASTPIAGIKVELQEPAMKDLQAAIAEANESGVKISPNGNESESSRRTFAATIALWTSRVDPALKHWVAAGKITKEEAARIKALSPTAQVPDVLKLEEQGIYFSKDFAKSILYSVAAPGASQHLWMLAMDVKENGDAKVREILAKHNWYQTVSSDVPHFTYLGVPESELPKLGLKKITSGDRIFWVPAL